MWDLRQGGTHCSGVENLGGSFPANIHTTPWYKMFCTNVFCFELTLAPSYHIVLLRLLCSTAEYHFLESRARMLCSWERQAAMCMWACKWLMNGYPQKKNQENNLLTHLTHPVPKFCFVFFFFFLEKDCASEKQLEVWKLISQVLLIRESIATSI